MYDFHAHDFYLADVGLLGRQFKDRDTSYKYSRRGGYAMSYIIKIKIHSSCEIEYFVEIHLCTLCVILRYIYMRCHHY